MHFAYWEYVQFYTTFRYMYMNGYMCMVTHVCTRQYTPNKWAKSLCSGLPLAVYSVPRGKKSPFLSEAPSTQVPSIPQPYGSEPASSAFLGPFFRSGVQRACMPPAQGVAKGYYLKEDTWTSEQKEERTERAGQYAFPTPLCSCSENSSFKPSCESGELWVSAEARGSPSD